MLLSEKKFRELIRELLNEGRFVKDFSFGDLFVNNDNNTSNSNNSSDDIVLDDEEDSVEYVHSKFDDNIIKMVIDVLKKEGISNDHFILGVLCVIAKESGFVPKDELGYKNTSVSRIKEVFRKNTIRCGEFSGRSFSSLSDEEINKIKSSNKLFFNTLYGGRIGNNCEDDGWNYRGRGFNQLTGRANYKKYGFESNPDAVNQPENAAKVVALFMKNGAKSLGYDYENCQSDVEGINMASDINSGRKNADTGRKNAMKFMKMFQGKLNNLQ